MVLGVRGDPASLGLGPLVTAKARVPWPYVYSMQEAQGGAMKHKRIEGCLLLEEQEQDCVEATRDPSKWCQTCIEVQVERIREENKKLRVETERMLEKNERMREENKKLQEETKRMRAETKDLRERLGPQVPVSDWADNEF